MQEIRFYNTLGRTLEPFRPLADDGVRVYTCGPTVYGHVHIGNLRTFVFEDFLCRALRFLGHDVTQVMNLTDVDDKTIRGARERGLELDAFTAEYIDSFFADLDTLRVERAQHYPRATEHIAEMIALVEKLVDNGHAYRGEDGSVFFRIAADEDYGKLSRIDLGAVRRGSRVESDEYDKEDVRDFVLWKAAKEGEPSWDSPWGPGRPGWHIECSAMAMRYLGETFDIHCGGVDNLFPHHENEIAQSESATGQPFVTTWLHAEHLIVDGAKMSKSLGNLYTLRELVERGEDPRAVRYLFCSTHYRQKLNFTFDSLHAAGAALKRVDEMRFRVGTSAAEGEPDAELAAACDALRNRVRDALADDLGSAAALSAVFDFVRTVNRRLEAGPLGEGDGDRALAALGDVDRVFGVFDPEPWKATGDGAAGPSDEEVETLLAERKEARGNRDWARSDAIRDELQAAGIVLEDTPQGTRWRRG